MAPTGLNAMSAVLSLSGGKRTSRGQPNSVENDPLRSAPGSWQGIGGGSPPRGRSSQPPRPRVMHEVLLARAAVKRSQGDHGPSIELRNGSNSEVPISFR